MPKHKLRLATSRPTRSKMALLVRTARARAEQVKSAQIANTTRILSNSSSSSNSLPIAALKRRETKTELLANAPNNNKLPDNSSKRLQPLKARTNKIMLNSRRRCKPLRTKFAEILNDQ